MPEPRRAVEPASPKEAEDFERALRVVVDHSVRDSVRAQPEMFVEAILPGLLPAMRKMVAAFFDDLVASVQKILEKNLSTEGVKWRIEAVRTGRPYAEIALLHSLLYRVEQVFLIDYGSGLLLARRSADNAYELDADSISGMVTALLDFMSDAFRATGATASGTLQYNEYTVWMERGEKMVLAAFFRGNAPFELRETLRKTMIQSQARFPELRTAEERQRVEGEADELLRPCLTAALKPPERKSPAWRLLSILLVVIPPLLLLGYQVRSRARFARYRAVIEGLPGVVLTHADRGWRRYSFQGLRDPFAREPASALAEAGLDPKRAELDFLPFISLEGEILSARLLSMLGAPPTLKVYVSRGKAHFYGTAPFAWLESAQSKLRSLGGWLETDIASVPDDEALAIGKERESIEMTRIHFAKGSRIPLDAEASIESVVQGIREIDRLATSTRRNWRVLVWGFADPEGAEWRNRALSVSRAREVRRRLIARLEPLAAALNVRSYGQGPSEDEGRSVSFRVDVSSEPED